MFRKVLKISTAPLPSGTPLQDLVQPPAPPAPLPPSTPLQEVLEPPPPPPELPDPAPSLLLTVQAAAREGAKLDRDGCKHLTG